MKADIHPEYRQVLFRDISCDFEFVTGSCVKTDQTAEFEGQEYPLVVIDISSESHPFYTGTQKLMDTAGRVEKFYRKYGFERPEEQ
ncbi:MAG: type B 50S ribosomal protein L31 [Deltaproteobacteria bacterium]|nr:MAG: type B 50S ribosomal protein L31 [Deltaproteobacteria bacterium]